MPLSSSEIAQMNGAYQGMAMNNMAYAQQIGQGGNVYGGGYQGHGGDRMMGSAMSSASAIGAPLAAGAIGLAGLDPMSLGLKAGFGAAASGAGFGGALAAGAAVALPAMAVGGVMKYAGGQMMQGAQNQMGLNQQLRSGFNFQNSQGGQGFNRADMSSIGSAVHEMSQQFGPSGEIASFKELSGLAGKMGSMGFAQGVKDVKDFTVRFKDMVKSLKSMATDLGTTLEGAMEFAQAAKSSGVFGMQRSQAFTSSARAASISGGLALSEVTGAASIGSQISRSVGGLGRQGANAGIRTIGQIGTAQQMGILSEEDIYNVTGQTGAEGRQAYAASSMSKSASFLQSGKGRRMLASMAGKDGTLDESAVQQLLSGGMGISETMQNDRSHVTGAGAPVNRANFIRNEGRLRGAAMERLGGFLPGLQMMQWAESKGVNFDDEKGRDRAMLFAQRQLGMGRDEADQAIKMAQNMPQISAEMARSGQHDQYFQSLAAARKGQGVEGVKQRLDQAKELINGKLQKVGQDVFNAGSETIDSFFNQLFGTYVETYSKDIDSQRAAMTRGGATGKAAAQKAFGIGGQGVSKQFAAMATKGGNPALGGLGGGDLASALNAGSSGDASSVLSGLTKSGSFMGGVRADMDAVKYLLHGQSGAGLLKEKGFDIGGMSSTAVSAKLQSIQSVQLAAATGFNADDVALGAKGGDFLRKAYARQDMGEGDARMQNITKLIEKDGSAEMKSRLAAAKSPEEKAALIANFERGQGIEGKAGLASRYGLPEGGLSALLARGEGGKGTVGDTNRQFAEALGIAGTGKAGKVANVLGSALTMGLGGDFAENLYGKLSGTGTRQQEAGAYIKGEGFRNLTTSLFSDSKGEAAAAKKALENELMSQTGEDSGETMVKRRMLAGSDYMDFMRDKPNATKEEQEAWFKEKKYSHGETLDEVKGVLGGSMDILTERQKKDRAEMSKRVMSDASKSKETLSALGVMDATTGKLTADGAKGLTADGAKYANAVLGRTFKESMSGVEGETSDTFDAESKQLEGLSVADKRKLSGKLGGVLGGEAGLQASLETRLSKSRKGRAGAIGDIIGVSMDPAELKRLGGHNDEIAKVMAEKAGLGGKESIIKELTVALSGKGGTAAGALARVIESPEMKEAKEKQKQKQDEDANPIEAAVRDNTKKANMLLETLVKLQTGGTAALAKLAENSSGDPEGAGKGGGAAGTKKS